MSKLKGLAKKYEEKIIEYRRDFHKHPELADREVRTAAVVAEVLESLGIETQKNVGTTGVVGIIKGSEPGKVIALRADMDALPMQEENDLPYASLNKGVMHSCGHDLHTAILLGCAHVLNEVKDELAGTVKLVFQPAEENNPTGGAPGMIRDGVLENPKVDAMIGLHVWPSLETGTAAIKAGSMMAASDRIFITIKGKSSHGSEPQNGIDAVVTTGAVLTALQTIISREIGPQDSAVVTVATINGGSKYSIICDEVKLEGTVRTILPETRNSMEGRIERVIKGVTSAMGADYDFRYQKGFSVTMNDAGMVDLVYSTMKNVLGDGALIAEKSALGGEDFSFFAELVPAAYLHLGCRPKDIPFSNFAPIHNVKFNPDEKSMALGVELMAQAALDFCNK